MIVASPLLLVLFLAGGLLTPRSSYAIFHPYIPIDQYQDWGGTLPIGYAGGYLYAREYHLVDSNNNYTFLIYWRSCDTAQEEYVGRYRAKNLGYAEGWACGPHAGDLWGEYDGPMDYDPQPPTPSPTPVEPTPTPIVTPTVTPTATASPSPSPSATPSPSPSPSPTVTPSATPLPCDEWFFMSAEVVSGPDANNNCSWQICYWCAGGESSGVTFCFTVTLPCDFDPTNLEDTTEPPDEQPLPTPYPEPTPAPTPDPTSTPEPTPTPSDPIPTPTGIPPVDLPTPSPAPWDPTPTPGAPTPTPDPAATPLPDPEPTPTPPGISWTPTPSPTPLSTPTPTPPGATPRPLPSPGPRPTPIQPDPASTPAPTPGPSDPSDTEAVPFDLMNIPQGPSPEEREFASEAWQSSTIRRDLQWARAQIRDVEPVFSVPYPWGGFFEVNFNDARLNDNIRRLLALLIIMLFLFVLSQAIWRIFRGSSDG